MPNDLDNALIRVANARRMAAAAQRVSKAASEARVDALRNLAVVEAELEESLNERIKTYLDAS